MKKLKYLKIVKSIERNTWSFLYNYVKITNKQCIGYPEPVKPLVQALLMLLFLSIYKTQPTLLEIKN